MKAETEFKLKFRSSVGWSSSVEPAPGGDPGFPDLVVMVKDRLIPIELKLGEIKDGRIFLKGSGLRPAQSSWHHKLWKEGGFSIIAVGIKLDGQWMTYFVPVDDTILDWRQGWLFTEGELYDPECIYARLVGLVRFRFDYTNSWTGD